MKKAKSGVIRYRRGRRRMTVTEGEETNRKSSFIQPVDGKNKKVFPFKWVLREKV